jgi:alpha-tubulin suppressor-like RCC1 family protein
MLADLRTIGTWVLAGGLLAGSLGAAAATREGQSLEKAPLQGEVPIAAGFDHACGLTPGGEALCWGHNGFGQIGDGTRTTRSRPTPLGGEGLTLGFVAAGTFHTCGVTTNGAAYCWGRDLRTELGSESEPLSPTELPGGTTFRGGELLGSAVPR